MKYQISYKMAVELLHRYLEKIYALDRHKSTSVVKVQKMYDLNAELAELTSQLKNDGHKVDEIIREIKQSLETKYRYTNMEVYIDGAARGNDNVNVPNMSGLAFAVYGDSQLLYENAIYLGDKIALPKLRNEEATTVTDTVDVTNNVAEYYALVEALEYLVREGLTASHIAIYSDSNLVVNQVNMVNTTRVPHLIRLRNCALQLLDEFDNVTLTHIPREQNEYVDELVNKLLDQVQADKDKRMDV